MATPSPVTVAVTGAAGQIGYAALFRIAAGAMLGRDTPVRCGCSSSLTPCAPPRAS